MKKIFAAIALGLFSVAVLAETSMNADASPLGHSLGKTADVAHLEEHGC